MCGHPFTMQTEVRNSGAQRSSDSPFLLSVENADGSQNALTSELEMASYHQLVQALTRLHPDSRERRAYELLDKFSSKPLSGLPSSRTEIMTKSEFAMFAARYHFGLPNPAAEPKLHNPIMGHSAAAMKDPITGERGLLLDPHCDVLTRLPLPGLANFAVPHDKIARSLVRLAKACRVRVKYEPRNELDHLVPPSRLQEFRDSNVQGIRPDMILYLPVPVRDEDEDGWSDTTQESWVEIKTLH